ncbi:MAG: RND transporter, partial [Gammaproteobacteria bacterium]|nr:RND transporter [Gammaproteobacteria bacterium]
MDQFYTAISQFVIKQRYLVLLLSLLVFVGSAFGLKPLIDDYSLDYRVLFSEKNPQYMAFLSMEETFGKRDNIMIVLEPADGNVYNKA